MKSLLIIALLSIVQAVGQVAVAADNVKKEDLASDFDALGGNKTLLERAKALEPEVNVQIVQDRVVSRRNRVEIAPEISGTFGGDTYNRTHSLGLNLNYHFTPRWSAGLKYNYAFNALTTEGEAMMHNATEDFKKNPEHPTQGFPDVDYPKSETLALIDWYPLYGKMNLLDKGVLHFDMYVLGGYGQVQLASGGTSTYTGGMGLGLWFTQHFTSRVEMRYQNYKAKYIDGEKNMDLAIASVQMGWML
jgi:outer membrane beta-barrel protein